MSKIELTVDSESFFSLSSESEHRCCQNSLNTLKNNCQSQCLINKQSTGVSRLIRTICTFVTLHW